MEQLALALNVALTPGLLQETIHDPYWDEITKEQSTEINFLVLEPPSLLPVPEQDLKLNYTQYRYNHDYYVLEPVKNDSVPEQITQWVEIYSPSKRKRYEYYRYCWKCKGKIKHKHICGGNIQSPIANARKQIIEHAIKKDYSFVEIEGMINNWSNSKNPDVYRDMARIMEPEW